jgi:hypothetical protein
MCRWLNQFFFFYLLYKAHHTETWVHDRNKCISMYIIYRSLKYFTFCYIWKEARQDALCSKNLYCWLCFAVVFAVFNMHPSRMYTDMKNRKERSFDTELSNCLRTNSGCVMRNRFLTKTFIFILHVFQNAMYWKKIGCVLRKPYE